MMWRALLIAVAVVCVGSTPAAAQLAPLPPQPAEAPWPTQEWTEAPLPVDTNRAQLEAAVAEAFAGFHPDLGETRALVVVQGGRIVFERYGRGYGRDNRLISWSVAKSITHALVGTAVLQGLVNIDTPLQSPHWRPTDPRSAITWRQFLNMVDGQTWSEVDAKGVLDNDSALMLYGEGRGDTARFGAGQRLIHAPGAHWNYNSGGTVLIADALTRAVAPRATDAAGRRATMRTWMDRSLFEIIGMRPVVQFDRQGLFLGSSQIYATARDFARFGLLYMRGGVWDGKRVLPEGWVDFARRPGPSRNADIYGAHWWVTPARGTGRPYRALIPDNRLADAFSAQGHEGQLIVVVPTKDLILVRLGRFDDTAARWNALGDWTTRVVGAFADRPLR
jgi:CubicO group peptidase (beta-lactamase class C family)